MNLLERAYAQTLPTVTVVGGSEGTGIRELAQGIINVILMIAGVIAVIYLIYSGILYVTAAGNPDNAKKGQQGIINAIIGLVIIVLAYVIVQAVISTASTVAPVNS